MQGCCRNPLPMDDLLLSAPEDVAKRLRSVAEGLTDPADIAAVNEYADELERKAQAARLKSRRSTGSSGALTTGA